MKEPSSYPSREQTFLKHFLLEKYLERVAHHIAWFEKEFVYVDAFGGPWRSQDPEYGDASFRIAIDILLAVRRRIYDKTKETRKIRCIFVEANKDRATQLRDALSARTPPVDWSVIHGEFEAEIDSVVATVGRSFALTFIDPTGWKGIGMHAITPVLKLRGEVIVNIMYDHLRRFVGTSGVEGSVEALFGDTEWRELKSAPEPALVEHYVKRLKAAGSFPYGTWTRILNPAKDRTHFYLVQATRHWKGLSEFREVEAKLLKEQDRVRADAKQRKRESQAGQRELFADAEAMTPSPGRRLDAAVFEERARVLARELLADEKWVGAEGVIAPLLELPTITWTRASSIILEMREAGALEVAGMTSKQRRIPMDARLRSIRT